MNRTVIYLLFIIGVVGIGSLVGLFTLPGDWYQGLQKPSFNPPGWIFGPVWTVLYILIGIAGARTWIEARNSARMKTWFVQMVLNFLWSPAFFGLESPLLALIVIVPMLVSIIVFIRQAWQPDRVSALCFLPYAAWVSFATVLNLSILLLN